MGKAIKKVWFGTPVTVGSKHIKVNGAKFSNGAIAVNASIVKQTGSSAYMVTDGTNTEILKLANATAVGGLVPGQCYILTTPFGGSAIPCKKITQFKVYTYEANGTIGSYTWSSAAATAAGQSTLVQ